MARLFEELGELCSGAQAVPGHVERARQLLRPHYQPERPPYVYELMPPLENPQERVREIEDPDGLLKDMAYPWLFFSKDELLPYWQKVQELETSVLVVANEIKEERSREILRNAADELCVGKTRVLWQRFFEEEAMWLKLSGQPGPAMWAWIAARHLASGAAPSENIVCLKIVGTSMAYYWPEEFEPKKEQTDPFCRTESGLIVPC
jgi:hypothetical protein